jgi:hypothetical protein
MNACAIILSLLSMAFEGAVERTGAPAASSERWDSRLAPDPYVNQHEAPGTPALAPLPYPAVARPSAPVETSHDLSGAADLAPDPYEVPGVPTSAPSRYAAVDRRSARVETNHNASRVADLAPSPY